MIQTLFVMATYLARNVILISVKVIKVTCYVYTYIQAVMIGTIYPLMFLSGPNSENRHINSKLAS